MVATRFFVILFLIFLSLLSPFASYADITQNLNVSMTVPPRSTDYQFSFSVGNNQSPNHQNTTLTYQILYGVQASAGQAAQTTIVADFSNDSVGGGDILNYITGSASNGFNNTVPVVDLIHRTITWNIAAIPAGTTDQVVSFQLSTNSNYTGADTVPFSVKTHMTNPYVSFSDQTISQTYQYAQPQPLPTPTPFPTLTPIPTPLLFSNIALSQLSAQIIGLDISTTTPAKMIVYYGTSLKNLNQTVNTLRFSQNNEITLDNLTPQTTYYVKIIAKDAQNNILPSDVYTFTTANNSDVPAIKPDTVVFTSSDIVMYDPQNNSQNNLTQASKPLLLIPENTAYNFRFQTSTASALVKVLAIVRNKKILGITSTETVEPNTTITQLIETANNIFEGRLQTPVSPGTYQLFIRMYDTKGNITEQPIADIRVNQGITVTSSKTNQPIESAQVFLYYKSFLSGAYEPLPPELFPVKNPAYTDLRGHIRIPLPQGQYKIRVTALGYEQQEVFFRLGPLANETYPHMYLKPSPFNLMTTLTYYWTIGNDSLHMTKLYIQNISESIRFFQLNALIATACLVFLTLLSFSARIHIPFRSLLDYFLHLGKIRLVRKKLGQTITGRVFDKDTGETLSGSEVYIVDESKQSIVGHQSTDKNGNFVFSKAPGIFYTLEIMKEGYEPAVFRESEIQAVELGGYLLGITNRKHAPSFLEEVLLFGKKTFALLFEALLILSLIFEISLGYALGFEKTFVFILFSISNITLWIIHLTHLRSEKNIF